MKHFGYGGLLVLILASELKASQAEGNLMDSHFCIRDTQLPWLELVLCISCIILDRGHSLLLIYSSPEAPTSVAHSVY